ncbi:Copper(I)-binding protein [Frankineae bacterium MT45]|nr:Copper(I)-binding protein [Frankineae bacterium MT45]
MRVSVTIVGAVAVAALGFAGLVRGAVPVTSDTSASSAEQSSSSSMAMDMGSGAASTPPSGSVPSGASAGIGGPIEVTGAYVQEPASPDVAAAYFTMRNTTGTDDRLVEVVSGAAETTTLHTDSSMSVAANGVAVPAHQTVSLSVGHGHVMMQQLLGPLLPGQTVNLILRFENAPSLTLAAPVIAIGAPVPAVPSNSKQTSGG